LNSQDRYLARASKTYHRQLASVNPNDHPGVRRYLISHGISKGPIINRYRLGVVDVPLSGDERYTAMLVIPYLSRNGVKAIRFRNLGDGKPKFAQPAGQSARLYNTAAYFTAGDTIGLAEGEIDAIAATECLGVPTIGIPGAEMWTAHRGIWAPIFKNFARVLIFRDGDQAGQDLADAVSESLKYRARVISPPPGEDVSSMIAAGREKELTEKIANIDEDDDSDADEN